MSMKPEGRTAEIIPFPTYPGRGAGRTPPKTRGEAAAGAVAMPTHATPLLAVAEMCWYHDEAVAETRKH